MVRSPGRLQSGLHRPNSNGNNNHSNGHINGYGTPVNGYTHLQEPLAHEPLHSPNRYAHRNGGATSPRISRHADAEVEAVNERHSHGLHHNDLVEYQDEEDVMDEHEGTGNVFLNHREDTRVNNPFQASSSSPQNSRRGSQSLYASFERARHEAAEENDLDGYDSPGYNSDDVDIGSNEYDSQPEGHFQGHHIYDDQSDDDSEDSFERAAKAKKLKRQAKELKREQEQLGFIKHLTNFLRKQRDEFGWGSPQKQKDGGESDGEDEILDTDLERDWTSARVRRGSPWRRSRRHHRDSTSMGIDNDDRHHEGPRDDQDHHYQQEQQQQQQQQRFSDDRTEKTPTRHRTLALSATAPEILQHRPAAPATLQRTPSALQRTKTPPTLQRTRTTTPPARHRPATPPTLRRADTPPPLEHYWEDTAPTRRKDVHSSARKTSAPQTVQHTEATTSSIAKIQEVGKSWVHAGVASGLLNPGTLMGVAILCLVVLMRSILGYDGSMSQQAWRNRDASCNDTVVQPSPAPTLKGVLSNTWDRLAWRSSSPSTEDQYGASEDKDTTVSRGWLGTWIPQAPALRTWIPTWTKDPLPESKKNTIQVPAEDIHNLEQLESRIDWIQKMLVDLGHADEQLSQDFQSKFDGMSVWIAGVEHKLSKVSEEVKSLREYVRDGQWIEDTVLELIRDEVPRHLVVSRDPATGKLSIPEEFWDTARQLFMTAEQVEVSVKDKLTKLGLDDQEQEESSNAGNGWNWRSAKKGKGAIVSWDDFLRENEHAMSEFVEGRMSKVSRGTFLSLVKTEANEIWQGLERNVMALLEKQGKLQGKNAPRHRSSSASDNRALTEVEQELIMGLIDEALEKYSADAIGKPDFALWSAGGRIIPLLTSPSYYQEVKPTIWGQLGLKYLVKLPRRENPSEKAIQPDVHAGECWAMQGRDGQLGVRLAREIYVEEVTIEHADPSVVLDTNSAPKELEIWGIGADEGTELAASNDPIRKAGQQQQQQQQKLGSGNTNKEGSQWREGIPWEGATLLTTIRYDTEGGKPRQTFSIPLSKQTNPSMAVVVRVKSNWGHPNYTCLYRVRVHGHERTAEGH
ncbi:hypothetical protein B0O80DRAFT_424082 [Mortierella sp. GBAus27b]|nr:hypothetical protein BGX31_000063 [Mortierella sp. GBA43]KAI8357965.1 hypothetical protein B0O80DRAFT_424082 [Mortierella sp. GBAus27b]